jgi:CrcB protein
VIKLLVVGLGGFVGAVLRYALSSFAQDRYGGGFPLGTLCVNVIGCFLAGALWTFFGDRELLAPNTRLFLGIGLLGSLTTFSAFGVETVGLARDGELPLALLSVAGNVVLGVAAVLLGHGAMRLASG